MLKFQCYLVIAGFCSSTTRAVSTYYFSSPLSTSHTHISGNLLPDRYFKLSNSHTVRTRKRLQVDKKTSSRIPRGPSTFNRNDHPVFDLRTVFADRALSVIRTTTGRHSRGPFILIQNDRPVLIHMTV